MDILLELIDSPEMNELHRAVQENRWEAVKTLIKNGADVANTINEGQTPLHISVKINSQDITEELCKNKSREELRNFINRRTLDTGSAALHAAAENNSIEITRFLLSRGANFEIRDNQNKKPKQLTSEQSVVELFDCVEEVFDTTLSGDNKILLDALNSYPVKNLAALMYARNSQDCTALQAAMGKNNLDAMATIINFRIEKLKEDSWESDAEIDKLVRHSKAARLHLSNLDAFCHENDDDSMVDSFMKKDVVDLLRDACEFLEAYKELGDRSLDNQPSLVVIEESLQLFCSCTSSGFVENNRIDLALRKGPKFVVKLLKLCIVAPMRLFMQQVYSSKLLEAAAKNDLVTLEKCLSGHPNINKGDDGKSWTALHFAFNHANEQMIKLLLDFGADPTSQSDTPTDTPLHLASRQRDSGRRISPEVMQLLFDRVPTDKLTNFINARSPTDSSTALHMAVESDNLWLVEFLLKNGAIYCARDNNNWTPIRYSNNYYRRVQELLNATDRSFIMASTGKIDKLIQTMRDMDRSTLLAIGGARDDEGLTLDKVVKVAGYDEEAEKIRRMVEDARSAESSNPKVLPSSAPPPSRRQSRNYYRSGFFRSPRDSATPECSIQ